MPKKKEKTDLQKFDEAHDYLMREDPAYPCKDCAREPKCKDFCPDWEDWFGARWLELCGDKR